MDTSEIDINQRISYIPMSLQYILGFLFLFTSLLFASSAGAATFGNTGVGSNTDNSGYAGFLGATKFTSPADCGDLTDLTVYSVNAPANDICIRIYIDSSGYPGTKITEGCVSSGLPWGTVSVSASLSPNTDYWLVFGDGDGGYSYSYDPGAANQFVKLPAACWYSNPPSNFPGSGTKATGAIAACVGVDTANPIDSTIQSGSAGSPNVDFDGTNAEFVIGVIFVTPKVATDRGYLGIRVLEQMSNLIKTLRSCLDL